METIINLAIIGLAILGGLYALGLIIVAVIGPPTISDEYEEVCSSECDNLCRQENHYEGQEWRCHY